MKSIFTPLFNRLLSRWIACRLVSDRQSVIYGLYFSYPLYIILVILAVLTKNSYLLLLSTLIAFLGIKLPLHPFDYIYNYVVVKLLRTRVISGRGSELQVNSIIAVIFTLIVFTLISLNVVINYEVLAIIYALTSIFFILIFIFRNDSKS